MDFQRERIFKGPGFAETLYLGICDGQRIIRKASNPDARAFSRTALVREIRLLRHLPEELKPFFPELIRTNLGNQAENSPELPEIIYYDMPYYPPGEGWVTLSRCLIDGTIEIKDARNVLGEILDTAFKYFRIDEKNPDTDYAEKTMLRAIRESLEWADSETHLHRLFSLKYLQISGKNVRNVPELGEYFNDTPRMRDIITPYRDRFLHGDFFPENILYNRKTKRWILLDPVSVRGVHRGDFVLDLNKMDDWLSGELPALRMGQFTVEINGSKVDFSIHGFSGKLEKLRQFRLSEWYRERLGDKKYAGLFSSEPGWKNRWIFVKAFYSFSMLPLADKKQAVARYFLALKCISEFIEHVET